jgi:hypothetical protein
MHSYTARDAAADYEAMGQHWLGLGNLAAPYWFCSLYPGGTERPEWPAIWATKYGGAEVIDGRRESADPDHARWFGPSAGLQPTWQGMIRVRLAFEGRAADDEATLRHQRDAFIADDGAEAVLELSAYAVKGPADPALRNRFIPQRVERMRELLHEHEPTILVCCGTSRRSAFERLCGGKFDENGFQWSGSTLCAIATHPAPVGQPPPDPKYWLALGRELHGRQQIK